MLRERVPQLEDDRYLAPDIAAAAELVRAGALVAVERAGVDHLPRIDVEGDRRWPPASTTPASSARRAARQLSAKSWLTEAPLRMLMNNLDPEVAEKPHELVVYGGIGRAARDWESFDRIVGGAARARSRRDAAACSPASRSASSAPTPTRRAC